MTKRDEEDSNSFNNKLKKLLPSDKKKIDCIVTFLGCAMCLIKVIGDQLDLKKLSSFENFAIAILCSNINTLINSRDNLSIFDLSDFSFDELELEKQGEEIYYRRTRFLLEKMMKVFEEHDKV